MGSYARLYGGIEERLTAAEDLRANGAATHAMWRFVEESTDAMASSVRRERAFLRMWWLVQGAVAGGSTISLVVGTALVSSDVITVGTAFLLFQYVLLLGRPLEDVVDQLETVQKANGAMVRVIDLLAVRPAIDDGGTSSPPAGPLAVAFHHVSFDYGDGQPVLSDIDLRGGAGTFRGRGGPHRQRQDHAVAAAVAAGRHLGGHRRSSAASRSAQIPRSELRRRVAMIPQEVELFSGTVRDNVTLFDTTPSDDAVAHALRRAGLDSLVDGGIHRELGAGGAGLSAGEAQLLALARVYDISKRVTHSDIQAATANCLIELLACRDGALQLSHSNFNIHDVITLIDWICTC
jgi:ATP-binding cassette subfamily B protein